MRLGRPLPAPSGLLGVVVVAVLVLAGATLVRLR